MIAILYNIFERIKEEGILQNSFNEAGIIIIRKQENILQNIYIYSSISLININVKIFSKILTNQIQKWLKNITHHDQVGFMPGMQH